MKKILFAFAAGLLLLAGCAKEYDDSALKEKVDALDKKVTALQAEVDKLKSDVSGISTVVEAWKNADVITKVEEIKEGDKVTGYTLTFKSGKTISLFNGKDGANAPVIGTKKDGDQLYWTVGGEYLIVDGKKVPVNVVPSFELKDGHLWVTIGGAAQDLGPVSEGSSVDGIIKSIVPGEKTVVFTLNGNPETVFEIPLAKPFGFVFEKNDYVVLSADPIVIAYTINGKTEKTDVGILKADLAAEIDAEKITVTPADATDKGEVVVWASNHIGQADIARLTFGPQEYANTDPAPEDPENKYDDDVNYIAEATEGAVAAHVTTNVDFTVKPEVDWITVGEITKASYTINFTIADNPQEAIRYGTVKIVLKSNEEVVLQTIKIAQAPGEKKFADGQWVLNTNNVDMQTHVNFTDDESMKGLTNYTYEIRFYANTFAKVSNGNSRRLANISNASEGNNLLLRFGDANDNPGVLVVNGIINNVKTNFRFDALEWNTISITGDGTTARIYKNGEEIWSGANTGKLDATTFELGMSYRDGTPSYPDRQVFDGYIDYVRVWNVTRSAAEIKAGLCDVAKDAEGLKAYWVVDGKNKPAGVFADATGHGYDMDFSKTWRSGWTDNEPDVSALVASQWFDFTEPVCPPAPAPDPTYWEVDVLDMAFTGITTGTAYAAWSGKEGSASDAVYAGQSASYNGQCIQLRTNNNNSGIVSTTSGGKLKKIEIKFNQATSDRTIDIYGKNEAYTQATDLYNAATQGTKLGSIQAGTRNYVLYVEGDYQYVGLRSNNGSIYVNEFKISWEPEPGPSYKDLSDKKANCYVIDAPGAYKIPALKGNGTESVGAVTNAAIVWETYNNAEEVAPNSVIAKVGVEEGFITFETPATLKPGNALIAAKDADGKILWSWHIWIPASNIADIDNGIHTTAMMDRNLGALDVAVASADAKINVNTMGMWYQWGRKDPFPGPKSIDVEGEYPGFASVAGTAIEAKKIQLSLEESIQQPTVFARGLYVEDALSNNDWKSGDPDGTLWGDKGDGTRTTIEDKSIYDPCPAGYRVPARDRKNADESATDPNKMWAADLANGAGWNFNATNYWFTFGNPAAVFPAAGYCDGGSAKTTFRTCIWNAHHDGDNPDTAYCLYVYLSSGAPKFANYGHGKSRGYYVRCCK